MRSEGRTIGSLNIHISAVNSWLDFLGRKEFHLKLLPWGNPQKPETPALTWSEYLRLLQAAQTLGNKRTEMLIKLFCETGLRLREALNVTLEAFNAGRLSRYPETV